MKYHGHHWMNLHKDPDGRVPQAVLTTTKLSLDYEEGDYTGHLEGKSTKAEFFEGHYTYSEFTGVGDFSFRLYRSGDRVLLFGTWYWPPTEEDGTWVIVLDPA